MFSAIFKKKLILIIFAVIVLFVYLYYYNDIVKSDYHNSKDTQMRMAVIQTLGGPCIPIIAQCCTSRNISEGIYARRSDIPGGFCYHADCDLINTKHIYVEKRFSIKRYGN